MFLKEKKKKIAVYRAIHFYIPTHSPSPPTIKTFYFQIMCVLYTGVSDSISTGLLSATYASLITTGIQRDINKGHTCFEMVMDKVYN